MLHILYNIIILEVSIISHMTYIHGYDSDMWYVTYYHDSYGGEMA